MDGPDRGGPAPADGADAALDAALEEYFRRRESGREIDLEDLLSRHPGCREPLAEFLRTEALLEEAAGGLRVGPPREPRRILRYELEEELGRGATGIVYRARPLDGSAPVALKLVECGPSEDSPALKRLVESSTASGVLDHPNIVRILEHGPADPGLYSIAMEYIEGRTLEEILADEASRDEAMAPAEAVRIARAIAEGVDHAHRRGVVHRDLKPSNVMVDRSGRVVVADFGLAKSMGVDSGITMTGEIVGTPRYMSPEQAMGDPGKVGPLADVYAIGAILYELLVGRPVFEDRNRDVVIRKVAEAAPTRPRTIRRELPEELERICLRCLEKRPRDRWYATAGELAADLGRWQAGLPVRARPMGPVERGIRWCRAHPTRAVLAASLAVLLVGSLAGSILVAGYRSSATVTSTLRIVTLIAAGDHTAGWREEAWRRISALPSASRVEELRDLATAALIGLDATERRPPRDPAPGPGSRIAFGDRRLIVASPPGEGSRPTRIWDLAANAVGDTGVRRMGPVAVRGDGRALQLSHEDGARYALRDLDGGSVILDLDAGLGPPARAFRFEEAFGPALALAAGGAAGAALLEEGPGGARRVVCWDLSSGQRTVAIDAPPAAIVLALSSGGELLGIGGNDGAIEVRTVPEGRRVLARGGRELPARALAFGRNPFGAAGGELPGGSWILAAGYEGGLVAAWDVGTGQPFGPYRGSWHWINCVAFSPDGATLASGGKTDLRLWDVATGRLLLRLPASNTVTDVAFSPDGTRLGACSIPMYADPGCVHLWDLEEGKGIRALRGLSSPASLVAFSRDAGVLAALACDWTVALWRMEDGSLLRVLPAPPGTSVDFNSALALDDAGRRLFFASGERAVLWDAASGRPARSWRLPPGLADRAAFLPGGALRLLRTEPEDPGRTEAASRERTTVRLRDLSGDPPRIVAEVRRFLRPPRACAAPDGKVFAIEGDEGTPGGHRRVVIALDGATGRPLWEREADPADLPVNPFVADPTGACLLFAPPGSPKDAEGHRENGIFDAATGERIGTAPLRTWGLAPGGAGYLIGTRLLRPGKVTPVISIGDEMELAMAALDPEARSYEGFRVSEATRLFIGEARFSPDGRRLAWGTADGRVMVCDLPDVERRLARLGEGGR